MNNEDNKMIIDSYRISINIHETGIDGREMNTSIYGIDINKKEISTISKKKFIITSIFRFTALYFFATIFSFQVKGNDTYTLGNQSIKLTISSKGELVELKNLETGQNYASGKPLWRLYFDRENEKDIEVLAKNCLPGIQQQDNQLIITYKNLNSGSENLKFELILTITLEGNMFRFASEISNHEAHTIIRELQYPLVGNYQLPSDHQLLTIQRGGHIYANIKKAILAMPHTYMGPDHHFRQMNLRYPLGVASNCYSLMGKEQELYVGSHNTTFQDTGHGFRLYPDEKGDFEELEVGLYKFPNCLSCESWSNNSNVIVPYNGDWHEISKIYRKWANTWWEHREEPLWVKEMIGFQRIILKHQYGETLFTYKDFPGRVKKAGQSVGINVAFPFGWWNSGMDNGYPDSYYVTDPKQGGDEAWKQAVTDYKKGGDKIIKYFNGKLIDTESDFYKNGPGEKICFNTNTGALLTEEYRFSGPGTFTGYYNARSFVIANTGDARWKAELKKMADRAIDLMRANCVFYDQLGYAENACRWDLRKAFPVPELMVIADKANALKMIHDYLDALDDQDFAVGTEHITDVTSQHVDFVHGIFHTGSWTAKAHTNFIDWFRYTFPEIILTDRNIDGDEPDIEWLTNRAMMLGLRTNVQTFRLRGLIDETPRYQEYLAKVNQLKEKYSFLLLLGTYRDTEGFPINNNSIQARSYVRDNQMAIVMCHPGKEEKETQLLVPGWQYKESGGVGDFKTTVDKKGVADVVIG